MQDIRQETLNEYPCGAVGQRGALEIDSDEVGGERYFSVMSRENEKVSRSPQGRQYQPYPIQERF